MRKSMIASFAGMYPASQLNPPLADENPVTMSCFSADQDASNFRWLQAKLSLECEAIQQYSCNAYQALDQLATITINFAEPMAEIRPFRAWRYNPALLKNIGELTSPLFDVATVREREELYCNPLNSIHLSIPRGDKPAKNAATVFNEWQQKNYIVQDEQAGIYV